MLFFSGCSEDSSTKNSSSYYVDFIDMGFSFEKSLILSYQGDMNLSANVLGNMDQMVESMDRLSSRVTHSIELSADLVTLLANEHTFNPSYASKFSLNPLYSDTVPVFGITDLQNDRNYLLVSSTTPLFLSQTTVKTLFYDNDSLALAWQRSYNGISVSKLYYNIYELDNLGGVNRIGNSTTVYTNRVLGL